MKMFKAKYLRVVKSENDEKEDQIFLYGFIGQDKWWDDDPTEPLTDLEVVRVIQECDAKGRPFHIRINSPGGYIMHGEPMITAISLCKSLVHTWVDGIAASMAFDIWASGHVRHMPENGKLMVHTSSGWTFGNSAQHRASAAMLDTFDEASIARFSRITGMNESDVIEKYYNHQDHWFSARQALEIGLIKEIESYEARHAMVDEPERLSYMQLLRMTAQYDFKDQHSQPLNEELYDWRHAHMQRLHILNQKYN